MATAVSPVEALGMGTGWRWACPRPGWAPAYAAWPEALTVARTVRVSSSLSPSGS